MSKRKIPNYGIAPGVLVGCDFSGVVAKLGKNLNPKFSFQVGDRVSGSVHGSEFLMEPRPRFLNVD